MEEIVHDDDKGRSYMIVKVTRYDFKDYTLTLSEENAKLLKFVVLTDCSSRKAKKKCFAAPQSYLNVKEGVVFWPMGVIRPPLRKGMYEDFCDKLVKNEVPPSTEMYPFEGVNYKITWKKHQIKAVYQAQLKKTMILTTLSFVLSLSLSLSLFLFFFFFFFFFFLCFCKFKTTEKRVEK